MIVFVGDKPSSKNKDKKIPFVGTQSYKTLLQWIWKMDIDITEVKCPYCDTPYKTTLQQCEVRECVSNQPAIFTNNSQPEELYNFFEDENELKEEARKCKNLQKAFPDDACYYCRWQDCYSACLDIRNFRKFEEGEEYD